MSENGNFKEPGKAGRLFSGFLSHFLQLLLVNISFLILNIPSMLVSLAYCLLLLPGINPVFVPENFGKFMTSAGFIGQGSSEDAVNQLYFMMILFLAMFLLGSMLVCIGPFQAGFSTIYRNIIRGYGVDLLSDFKEGLKENWKRSLISMLISWVFTFISLFSIGFYAGIGGSFGKVVTFFFVFLFLMFTIINSMVNYMIVTVDLPLKKMYKNSLIFFFIRLIPCIGLMILLAFVYFLIPLLLIMFITSLAYPVAVGLYFFLGFIWWQYLISFFTNELINKYMAVEEDENDEKTNMEYTDTESGSEK